MKHRLPCIIGLLAVVALVAICVAGCSVTNTNKTSWNPSLRIQSGDDADAPAGQYAPPPAITKEVK